MRLFLLFFFSFNFSLMAQDLPFSSIPEPPQDYSAANSVKRMIEGLGFRYYWATEDLKASDLNYRPSEEARNTLETIQHIYGLSTTILNAAKNQVSLRPAPKPTSNLKELRVATLDNLEKTAALFDQYADKELEELNIIFERGGRQSKFPLWNLINGPIADALYHTGQLVSFRRASGNPIAKGVNVFLGVKND